MHGLYMSRDSLVFLACLCSVPAAACMMRCFWPVLHANVRIKSQTRMPELCSSGCATCCFSHSYNVIQCGPADSRMAAHLVLTGISACRTLTLQASSIRSTGTPLQLPFSWTWLPFLQLWQQTHALILMYKLLRPCSNKTCIVIFVSGLSKICLH